MPNFDESPEWESALSQTAAALRAQEIHRPNWERWNEQNKDAIVAYNQRIESEGLPLARYRTFAKGR